MSARFAVKSFPREMIFLSSDYKCYCVHDFPRSEVGGKACIGIVTRESLDQSIISARIGWFGPLNFASSVFFPTRESLL